MPKVKLKDLKGIYTNIDETDLPIDYAKDSTNFKFEDGSAHVNYPALELLKDAPDLLPNYNYERGIEVELVSDVLSEGDTTFETNVTILKNQHKKP